jgi:hypothetical protein
VPGEEPISLDATGDAPDVVEEVIPADPADEELLPPPEVVDADMPDSDVEE